jgi:hypothetical protein
MFKPTTATSPSMVKREVTGKLPAGMPTSAVNIAYDFAGLIKRVAITMS